MIFNLSRSDPEAIRQLSNRPLEQTFKWLSRKATPTHGDRKALPSAVPEIAREVLLAHPDLYAYLARNLKYMGELIADIDYSKGYGRETGIAMTYYHSYLGFCSNLPRDEAISLIGPFMFSLYHPTVDQGDTQSGSPAGYAQDILASVVRKHSPGEDIPKDIEGARKWWRENWNRFSETPAYEIYPERYGGSLMPVPKMVESRPKDASSNGTAAAPMRAQAAVGLQSGPGLLWTALGISIGAAVLIVALSRKTTTKDDDLFPDQ